MWTGLIEHYRDFLPISQQTPIVTLMEGNTPLLRAKRLEALLGDRMEIYLKYEGTNPTGSFKDRGMTVAVSKALERGAWVGVCASTGNTSASAAAYCSVAGMVCAIVVPAGRIAAGKLSQALAHGAIVCPVMGSFDDALAIVRRLSDEMPVALLNSLNPDRLHGQKTCAFEICDALKDAPDFHILPVGNAGNITSHWMGYRQYRQVGRIQHLPILVGVQAAGAAPLVKGQPISNPETIATAIRIGSPARWQEAYQAKDESDGRFVAVSDDEIVNAYRYLAQKEGLFVEPASAAALAGLLSLAREGYFTETFQRRQRQHRLDRDRPVVVCVLTGHGLKDPQTALQTFPLPETLPPTPEAVKRVLKEAMGRT
ncbi:MAG: threonine synthase [Armatimonadota bacterium]|nr:threonine synthase [Armatimonadota bacterium]